MALSHQKSRVTKSIYDMKMNLKNLKVKSFVTNLDQENSTTIKGGFTVPLPTVNGSDCGGTLNAIACGATNVPACTGNSGGSGGWQPSIGCSNNSCAICYTE